MTGPCLCGDPYCYSCGAPFSCPKCRRTTIEVEGCCDQCGIKFSEICAHCTTYFQDLEKFCTLQSYGECDCPVCQGFCECKGEDDAD